MKATQLEIRYRAVIVILLYCLGFLAPWARNAGRSEPVSTAWLELSGMLAGAHWLTLRDASLLVTSLAVWLAFAGAALRVWAAAYPDVETAYRGAMRAGDAAPGELAASGPYRYVRNPFQLGLFTCSVAIAILMPWSGAVFFLAALLVFELRLIASGEARLASSLGGPYLAYCRRVPRFVPSLTPYISPSIGRPLWLRGALAEIGTVGVAFSFGILAWRYNAPLLIQSVIVCFGLSLIMRALMPVLRRDAVTTE